jgi:hypothetical protein
MLDARKLHNKWMILFLLLLWRMGASVLHWFLLALCRKRHEVHTWVKQRCVNILTIMHVCKFPFLPKNHPSHNVYVAYLSFIDSSFVREKHYPNSRCGVCLRKGIPKLGDSGLACNPSNLEGRGLEDGSSRLIWAKKFVSCDLNQYPGVVACAWHPSYQEGWRLR